VGLARNDFAAAGKRLKAATSITVISHVRPDGDAIGSLLGLSLSLARLGKQVTPVLADGLPGRFRFLPGAELVQTTLPQQADLTVAVDCSDLERLGFPPEILPSPIALNIDHHATNTRFAPINLVDPEAAATAEVLVDLVLQEGLPLDGEVAANLLAGIVTDTIGFRTSNVTPKVLRLAASLVELGAPLTDVYDRGLNRRTLAAARYWGSGLSSLESGDGMVWATLTIEGRRQAGYPGVDDADLINLLSTLEGAEVAIVFVEQPGGKVKVSWRSRSDRDVSRLAQEFGGGGHEPAAGAMIEGDLQEVKARVLKTTCSFLQLKAEGG
jgi:phosphoesterase RecJ-like protein